MYGLARRMVWSYHSQEWVGFKIGIWFVPAQLRTKPGLSPIWITFPSKWCRIRWFLNGLAWEMALSCHSQVNHWGGGSVVTRYAWFLDRTPSAPQIMGALSVACHPSGGWCLSISLTLDMHYCLRVSWQMCIIFFIFFFLHSFFFHSFTSSLTQSVAFSWFFIAL